YLQSQLSQELGDLAIGEQRWSFVLEPTGKVDALVRVARTAEETFQLEVDPGFGDTVLERIDRFKIRVKATTSLVPAPDDWDSELQCARIRSGWPAMGSEIEPGETIPGQLGLAAVAVSFTKGCYPGQELVERMDSRGATAPTTLRRLGVDAGTVAGDPITDADGREVGRVTSVCGTTALGFVRRDVELGDAVTHR
ncbi:MAG TPA: hypothetical protein VGK49_04890, partial [Ilumatobacteraceae bacterium]